MSAEGYAEYIQREPGVTVVADGGTILVAGHGGVVPLTFEEARRVAATITNLLAVHVPGPPRPTGLELVAERYRLDEPTEELGRLIPPYPG